MGGKYKFHTIKIVYCNRGPVSQNMAEFGNDAVLQNAEKKIPHLKTYCIVSDN